MPNFIRKRIDIAEGLLVGEYMQFKEGLIMLKYRKVSCTAFSSSVLIFGKSQICYKIKRVLPGFAQWIDHRPAN